MKANLLQLNKIRGKDLTKRSQKLARDRWYKENGYVRPETEWGNRFLSEEERNFIEVNQKAFESAIAVLYNGRS
jgi:pyocin large subunit-like protein